MRSLFKYFKIIPLGIIVIMLISCGGAEERKEKYLEKGKAYLEEKNIDKARIEFKNVLQIDPKFSDAYYYLGKVEEQSKEFQKALGYYVKAIDIDSNHVEAKIEVARVYLMIGTEEYINKSSKLIKEIFSKEPENVKAKLIASTIEYKTGNKNKAVDDLEKIVNENKKLIEGISILASIYESVGEENKLLNLLERSVADNGNNAQLRAMLAKIYIKRKYINKAENQLLEMIKINPDEYQYKVMIAAFYSANDQEQKAEDILRDAIKQDPDDPKRYLSLVELIAAKKGIKEAESFMLSAINDKPELYELRFALVSFYKMMGKTVEMKKILQDIIDQTSSDSDGVKARTILADLYLDESDFSSAQELLDGVLSDYPGNNDALYLNSKIAVSKGDMQTAINGLRTVLKSQPDNSDAALLLSVAYKKNNESLLAQDLLKNTLASNSSNPKHHVNYASYLVSEDKMDDAFDVVNQSLLYFKNNYDLLKLKSQILEKKFNDPEFVAVLDEMKLVNPNDAYPYVKKGQYFLNNKKYEQAISEIEVGLTKNVKDKYMPLQLIVKAYMDMHLPDKAISRINKILDQSKDDSVAQQLLGQIYMSQGNSAEAISFFKESIRNSKDWAAPYMGLASAYLYNKDISSALETYNEAINNLSNPVNVQFQLAGLYEKQEQYDNAIDVYEQMLSKFPNNKVIANNLASLLVDHSSDTESLSRAKLLVSEFELSDHPAFQDTLAWVYVKTGEIAKAIPILEDIVKSAPNVAIFKYHLGVAYANNGVNDSAKKHLTDAVQSNQSFQGKEEAMKILETL